MRLEALDAVDDEDAGGVEEQHRPRVGRPLHLSSLGTLGDPGEAVDDALQPSERLVHEYGLAIEDRAPCTNRGA